MLFVVAGLFIFGFIANVVNNDVDLANTIIQWLIAGTCIAGHAFVAREDREREELLRFLSENAAAIRAGEARYRGSSLTYATRLRSCEVVLSFLVVSIKLPSRMIVVGGPSHRSVQIGSSLITFVFGWWGIPWGPVWTVKTIVNNLRGKPEISVGELIEGSTYVTLPSASARD